LRSRNFFSRLKNGLSKTRSVLTSRIDQLFAGPRKIDEDLLEELEELLITSDLGVTTSMDLIEKISASAGNLSSPDQLKGVLKESIFEMIQMPATRGGFAPGPDRQSVHPHIIMVVGVNGSGKTTTIGKLASRYAAEGHKVLVAAGDTFRAAAVEQLVIWAERAGVEIVKHKEKTDPAAVAFDGVDAAIARNCDIVLIDTAGRLHTNVNLMEELKKIKRTIAKKLPGAPHETLLVLDATTGQNALSQAKLYHEAIEVTGLALTKLDGTAKGGIVVSICHTFGIPLKYVGTGEKIDDLQDFDPRQFVDALI